MATRKWKSMVNKALNNSTTKSVPTDWKKFTEIKINFLQELRNSNSVQDLDDNYDVYQLCFQDEEFVKRCLLVSLENSLVQFTMVIFSTYTYTFQKNYLDLILLLRAVNDGVSYRKKTVKFNSTPKIFLVVSLY